MGEDNELLKLLWAKVAGLEQDWMELQEFRRKAALPNKDKEYIKELESRLRKNNADHKAIMYQKSKDLIALEKVIECYAGEVIKLRSRSLLERIFNI